MPTWCRTKDRRLLKSHVQQFHATGELNVPDVFILPNRALTADEYQELTTAVVRLGPARLETVLYWQEQTKRFGPRSESAGLLGLRWRIECVQHFLYIQPEQWTIFDLQVAKLAERFL